MNDVVMRSPSSDRWPVAESKDSRVDTAVRHLRETTDALWHIEPGTSSHNTEVRVYATADAYARAQQTPEEGNGLGGYRVKDGRLGDDLDTGDPTSVWVDETVNGQPVWLLPATVRSQFWRERRRAGGYFEGWQFVFEVNGDPPQLRERLAAEQDTLGDFAARQMPASAEPRLYHEGLLRALTTALGYIEAAAPGGLGSAG